MHKVQLLICLFELGYSKKIQTEGGRGGELGIYFSEKTPYNFYICHFTIRNSRENNLSALEILQNCVIPLGYSKAKNQGNSTPGTPLEIPLFLIDPWNLHMVFLQYPWKFHVLSLFVWIFSGIAHCHLSLCLE